MGEGFYVQNEQSVVGARMRRNDLGTFEGAKVIHMDVMYASFA
ncbi:MAG: hypothetical protein ACI8XC_003764 [Gammaproteobacteria bacterium]|jgi:hypothetical protein